MPKSCEPQGWRESGDFTVGASGDGEASQGAVLRAL
jgi:hypothetical protein